MVPFIKSPLSIGALGHAVATSELKAQFQRLKQRAIELGAWEEIALDELGVRIKRGRRGKPKGLRNKKQAAKRDEIWTFYETTKAASPKLSDKRIADLWDAKIGRHSRSHVSATLATIKKIKAESRRLEHLEHLLERANVGPHQGRAESRDIRNKK